MARPKRTTPWLETRNGIYYAHWYDEQSRQTKRLSLRTSRTDEAEARFAAFLTEGKEIRAPRIGRLTVSRALDDYLAEHVAVNCADYDRQRDAARHLTAHFDDKFIEDIDIPGCRSYADARRRGEIGGGSRRKAKAGSDSTIRRELVVLRAASNHAKKWKRIQSTPSIELPAEKRLGVDDEAPYYTEEELARIFAAVEQIGGETDAFFKLLYYTGARRRSIENLTRPQVKMANRQLHLQPAGKRSTKKRQPIVPILRAMEGPVSWLLDNGGAVRLFVTPDFYRTYREICEGLDLGERTNPHIMRHTRITHLLQAGKSIYDVGRLVGDTVATIERVYGHHSVERLAGNLED